MSRTVERFVEYEEFFAFRASLSKVTCSVLSEGNSEELIVVPLEEDIAAPAYSVCAVRVAFTITAADKSMVYWLIVRLNLLN